VWATLLAFSEDFGSIHLGDIIKAHFNKFAGFFKIFRCSHVKFFISLVKENSEKSLSELRLPRIDSVSNSEYFKMLKYE